MDGNRDAIQDRARPARDWLRGEPPLDELLDDSVLHTLLRSDGIDPADLRRFLRRLRRSAWLAR
jgi:hypothetical protein